MALIVSTHSGRVHYSVTSWPSWPSSSSPPSSCPFVGLDMEYARQPEKAMHSNLAPSEARDLGLALLAAALRAEENV